jgi:hypothetical protein
MIRGEVDLSGLDRLQSRLRNAVDVTKRANVQPVLRALGAVIVEDNRAGVLAGTDKDGQPMPPLRYRNGAGRKTRFRKEGFGKGSKRRFADNPANDNLTNSQYRRLTGPRLAPRRAQSRSIKNLRLRVPILERTATGTRWVVSAAWVDVVSKKGVPFLAAHFNGRNRLPKYDLRGVRPAGMRKARELWIRWARAAIQQTLQGK